MSLSNSAFQKVLQHAHHISQLLVENLHVRRCGLASNGDGIISIIPLHGLDQKWEPVLSNGEEYHTEYPGFLTSKNGPKMADTFLDVTRARIAAVTGIQTPFNNYFNGDASDGNLFARVIRGEIPQWRIWEDDSHIAFLTPFGNTPGYTVVIPRKHLGSDILGLGQQDYINLTQAAYTVAQHLKTAFGVSRCGIFFEGFEIDYAHVKLVPVHDRITNDGQISNVLAGQTSFTEKYQGYLTTQFGPLAADLNAITSQAVSIRESSAKQAQIVAPKSWQNPATQSMNALQSNWYTSIFEIQDTIFHATTQYFKAQLGYRYALVPVTTDSISSPMGLGSDSLPVHVQLYGSQDTYLADSMQFSLEYVLRLEEGLKGAYYMGCSFRGEDPDAMDLNEFCDVEWELLGYLNDGSSVAEGYIAAVTKSILQKHRHLIMSIAGAVSHIEQVLDLLKANGGRFPRVTLSQALAMKEIAESSGAWEYAVASDPSKGRAITRMGERILIRKFEGAVWLTEMDHLSVPFYQAFVPGTGPERKAICADLLLGPGEVLGLGQRHRNAGQVKEALKLHEVPEEKYEWYLGIREKQELQTTGWGMGVERFLAWVLGHDDIRDLAVIPRLKGMRFQP